MGDGEKEVNIMEGEEQPPMENVEDEKDDRNHCLKQKPAVKHRGWKAMPYIIGNETFEKLATLGILANLLVYLTSVFHMKIVQSATLLNVFNGTTNLATLLGAYLSDAFFGRYKILGVSSIASLVGMFVIMLTAGIPKLHPPPCIQGQNCEGPTTRHLTVLIVSFCFLVIGAGGIRPCSLPFGADQFDPQTQSGKKGIDSFFNWYYFTLTFSVMVASTIIVYIQSNMSWTLGFGIPTVLMFFSCIFFFLGNKIYVKVKPEGSPFTSIAQVFAAAFRKRKLKLPENPQNLLFNPPHVSSTTAKITYTNQFRSIDRAAIITETDEIGSNGSANNSWRLCTQQQVEEVKCLLRIGPVWAAGIIHQIMAIQHSSFVVFQALQADRHMWKTKFEIPAGSFSVFSMLALTIFVPIYDRIVVPIILPKLTRKQQGITVLQRIGVGVVLNIVAMIVSGFVEQKRRAAAMAHPMAGVYPSGGAISSMSSLWLIPQLSLFGLSESFSSIGLLEFFYKQFPENMRSIAGALVFLCAAVSNYLSGFMVTIVHRANGGKETGNWLAEDLNKGKLDYFYFMLAGIGILNMMYFLACARWYRYKALDEPKHDLETNNVEAPSK